ncbi:MAG: hypothetical protein K6E51_07785 [Treponema sp.]|nr:hypothetical protein [Treponema sp.]
MKKYNTILCILLFLLYCCSGAFCAADTTDTTDATTTATTTESETPEPYTKEEFPLWAHNARRTEIITFGSLPFVTLGTTIAYSMYRYIDHDFSSSYIPNPFAKTSDSANLSTSEQMGILAASGIICIGLGITDLIFTLSRQKKERLAALQKYHSDNVTIEPLDELYMPINQENEDKQPDFLYGDIKSALF